MDAACSPFLPRRGARVWSFTCFSPDVGARILLAGVLRGAEVVIVVDKAIEGGGEKGVSCKRRWHGRAGCAAHRECRPPWP